MRRKVYETLTEDIRAVFAKDPAARRVLEVLLFYPGLHALWLHRLAHWLWQHRMWLAARCVSHLSRFLTGIEIHPGARIGRRVVIDHGSGVVIGETAVIGDDVLLYQGVVLGGTSLTKERRHPTLENDVTMGAGAVALGAITIGAGSRIGANAVVTKSVPPQATVVGVPGRVINECAAAPSGSARNNRPDPLQEVLRFIAPQREGRDQHQTDNSAPEKVAVLATSRVGPGSHSAAQFHEGDGI